MPLIPLLLDLCLAGLVTAYWLGHPVGPAAGAVLALAGTLLVSFPDRFPSVRASLDPRRDVAALHRRIRLGEGLAMIALGLYVAARPQAATTRDVALAFFGWVGPSALANLVWWLREGRDLQPEQLSGWPRLAALMQGEHERLQSYVSNEVWGGASHLLWIAVLFWIGRPVSPPAGGIAPAVVLGLGLAGLIALDRIRRRRQAERLRLAVS